MAGLNDILMQRAAIQFQNELRPSGFEGLVAGITQGVTNQIQTAREEQAARRKEDQSFTDSLNRLERTDARFGDKFETSIEGGKVKVIPRKEPTIIPQGFRVKTVSSTGTQTFERVPAGVEGLSAEQEIKATALSKKIAGVRGIKRILPVIAKRMQEGQTVDQIEDSLRFAGQSPEFAGPVRDAANSITIGKSAALSERALDIIDDKVSKGDTEGVKNTLKKLARDTAPSVVQQSIGGKERTVEFIDEIQDELDLLETNGIDTNIFTGTREEINKKIGGVSSPELRKVATKIQLAIINYRRSVSGAAFSVPESREYTDIFPGIGRTAAFNKATISALRETMGGDLKNFYSLAMGEGNYNQLFGGETQSVGTPSGLTDEQARLEFEKFQRGE